MTEGGEGRSLLSMLGKEHKGMMALKGRLKAKARTASQYKEFSAEAARLTEGIGSHIDEGEDLLAEHEFVSGDDMVGYGTRLWSMMKQTEAHLQGAKDARKRLEPVSNA